MWGSVYEYALAAGGTVLRVVATGSSTDHHHGRRHAHCSLNVSARMIRRISAHHRPIREICDSNGGGACEASRPEYSDQGGTDVNKQELVEEVSERCDLSKAAANRAVDSILDSITDGLQTGDEISFPGFGKFLTQKRKAREARDPRDGSRTVHVSAATVPKFRAGTNLRAAVESVEAIQKSRPRPPATSSGARAAVAAGWKPLADRG